MEWLIIITAVVCTFLIIKAIKDHSPEAQEKKLLDKIGSYKDHLIFVRDAILNKEPDIVESDDIQKLRVATVKMDDKYHKLVDRNKSDYKKILEITKDWDDYLIAVHTIKMAYCKLVVDLSNETAENFGDMVNEPNEKKKEIEDKLKKLLK